MRVVDSRNKVSCGGILWKTTLVMDDFPLLLSVSGLLQVNWKLLDLPSLAHQQQARLVLAQLPIHLC